MKEFKVIKTFPNQHVNYKVGDIISEKGYKAIYDIAKDWPEYFEELEVKDWEWYVEEYFEPGRTNEVKLANPLRNVSNTYLEATRENFLEKDFGKIWEYKIGLLKFICDDLGYNLPCVLYEIAKERTTYSKIHEICPKEFLKSVL